MEKIPWKQIKNSQYSKVEQSQIRVKLKLAVRKLKQERERLGITQQELARRAGLPRTTISKVESGFQNTTILKIMQIATALNKDVEITLV